MCLCRSQETAVSNNEARRCGASAIPILSSCAFNLVVVVVLVERLPGAGAKIRPWQALPVAPHCLPDEIERATAATRAIGLA